MQTERRLPGGNKLVVPCLAVEAGGGYQNWMGGVDLHDELRLQLAMAMKKYCKGLFIGLAAMALVNWYTVYKGTKRREGEKSVHHAKFLQRLQPQLLSVSTNDFGGLVSSTLVCAVCVLTITL